MFKLSVIFFFNIGSARHRKKLALEALAVVAEKDKPHLFITMTANPLWSEITELLLPGETAFSNMLVTCRVFKAKLAALLANLKNGHYFGGKSAYIIHVIEFQHRGLPHAHIVCRISNGSTKSQRFIDPKKNVNKYFYSIVKMKLTVVS